MSNDLARAQSGAAILRLLDPSSEATAIATHPQLGKPAIRLNFAPGVAGYAWTKWDRAWTHQIPEKRLEPWLLRNDIASVPVRSERVTTTGELAVVIASKSLLTCLALVQADPESPADDHVRQEAARIAANIIDQFARLGRGEADLGPWVRAFAFHAAAWANVALSNSGYADR